MAQLLITDECQRKAGQDAEKKKMQINDRSVIVQNVFMVKRCHCLVHRKQGTWSSPLTMNDREFTSGLILKAKWDWPTLVLWTATLDTSLDVDALGSVKSNWILRPGLSCSITSELPTTTVFTYPFAANLSDLIHSAGNYISSGINSGLNCTSISGVDGKDPVR